jgi:aerobic-type carbon monoxide dehydrogenase small subunit (CoxS/CutS family)
MNPASRNLAELGAETRPARVPRRYHLRTRHARPAITIEIANETRFAAAMAERRRRRAHHGDVIWRGAGSARNMAEIFIRGGSAMITLTVNGVARTFEGDPQMPLLWYLRDELKLKGAKFGCGIAQCGACRVLVNGVAQPSCVTEMSAAAGMTVTTIEGLSRDGSHPVQRAWLAEDVAQCGYCQTGQIITAAALLAEKPNPSDADIDQAMINICRCGTYVRIRKAIHRAAQLMREGAR